MHSKTAIFQYCLSLMFERDKEFSSARYYRDIYTKAEKEALAEFAERRPSNTSDDWSMQNTNPHRDPNDGDLLQQDIVL